MACPSQSFWRAYGKRDLPKTLAEVQDRHCFLWPCSQLWKIMPCVSKLLCSGTFNATIHVVVGGEGSHLSNYNSLNTIWSVFEDQGFGFVKLTSFNHSTLLFEYKRSSDGKVYDKLWITKEYKDILGCGSIGNGLIWFSKTMLHMFYLRFYGEFVRCVDTSVGCWIW